MTAATQHYRDNLAGKGVALHDGHPQAGFYKMRRGKDGPWLPVAIWEKDGQMIAVRGDGKGGRERVDPDDIWTWCASNPVKQAEAKYAFEHGKWESDAPTIGDNSKSYPDTYEGISAEIADYAELVEQFLADAAKAGGIQSKLAADKAHNMADKIGDVRGGLARKADELRDSLVRPHLEAQRDINAKFKPLIDDGKARAKALRAAADKWLVAEQARLQKIADEKAREEAAAAALAERARQEAIVREHLNPQMAEEIIAKAHANPPVVPDVVAEPVKIQVGGQRGAKRSLRTFYIAKVTDYQRTLAHFAEAQEMRDLIQKLAQRAVDAKMPTPPGVEIVEEKRT